MYLCFYRKNYGVSMILAKSNYYFWKKGLINLAPHRALILLCACVVYSACVYECVNVSVLRGTYSWKTICGYQWWAE